MKSKHALLLLLVVTATTLFAGEQPITLPLENGYQEVTLSLSQQDTLKITYHETMPLASVKNLNCISPAETQQVSFQCSIDHPEIASNYLSGISYSQPPSIFSCNPDGTAPITVPHAATQDYFITMKPLQVGTTTLTFNGSVKPSSNGNNNLYIIGDNDHISIPPSIPSTPSLPSLGTQVITIHVVQ